MRTVNVGRPERILSTLGAALMTWRGLRRGGLGGWLAAATGVAFIARGVSGFCPVYNAFGLNFCQPREAGHASDDERVEVASEDSFPASDPPSWNAGHDREV